LVSLRRIGELIFYKKFIKKKGNITEEERQLLYRSKSSFEGHTQCKLWESLGAEIFPMYFLPAAEATTALGRYIIMDTIEKM
jgi:DNA polymerase elongation subunit (family B)